MEANNIQNNKAPNKFVARFKEVVRGLVKSKFFYVMIGLILIDLLTKWIIVWNKASLATPVWIIPNFICVTLLFNTGAVFGLGDGQLWARILIICIRIVLAIIIPLVYFYKTRNVRTRYKVCLLMIYAGCVGNLIDGLFYWQPICGFDGVVDWIKFSFFNYVFNLADAYIVVAVAMLIIFFIIDEIVEVKARNRRGEYSMTPEEYEKHLAEENKKKNGYNNKKE